MLQLAKTYVRGALFNRCPALSRLSGLPFVRPISVSGRLTLSSVVRRVCLHNDCRGHPVNSVSTIGATSARQSARFGSEEQRCLSPFRRNMLFSSKALFQSGSVRGFATSSPRSVSESHPGQTFFYDDLDIEQLPQHLRRRKPDVEKIPFGTIFADHMFESTWQDSVGWSRPKITPVHSIQMHPAAKVLHYAQELFEGFKAYHGKDGQVRLFRPELNIERLLSSAERLRLPTFDKQEFLRCLVRLVDIDRDWVPRAPMSSLYIRPTFFGVEPTLGLARSSEAYFYVITGPVAAYYSTGTAKPISLLADPQYVRAWPGGTGDKKLGCNYAPTLSIQWEAECLGLQQVLWLFGEDQQITEVGAMNVFVFLRNKDGEPELVTPSLTGIILPGITRRSVLDLTREWKEFKVSERKITMTELREALREGRVMEMFGSGTACIISPIERIVYRYENRAEELVIPTMKNKDQLHARIMHSLLDIQYGNVDHSWSLVVKSHPE